jgi:hypothetical protein
MLRVAAGVRLGLSSMTVGEQKREVLLVLRHVPVAAATSALTDVELTAAQAPPR